MSVVAIYALHVAIPIRPLGILPSISRKLKMSFFSTLNAVIRLHIAWRETISHTGDANPFATATLSIVKYRFVKVHSDLEFTTSFALPCRVFVAALDTLFVHCIKGLTWFLGFAYTASVAVCASKEEISLLTLSLFPLTIREACSMATFLAH